MQRRPLKLDPMRLILELGLAALACTMSALAQQSGAASEGFYDVLPAPEPRQLGCKNARESPHLGFVKERLGARWKADFPVQQFESWTVENWRDRPGLEPAASRVTAKWKVVTYLKKRHGRPLWAF
jgi:hypothetical protein